MSEWRNWSGSVVAEPTQRANPRNAGELAALVTQAGKIRVVGAGHSFMPLCQTDGLLISMADYEAAIEIAPDRKTAWAPAGWSLDKLTAALWAEGLSLINQGDVNPQSLAGATATGTHGTGEDLGSIATQACGFRLMLADGSLIECGPDQRPDLYEAQRLSLGLFGVATEVRINVLPAYHLEERVERRPLAWVTERLDELAAATRHMEFFVFPYSDQVIFKTLHPVEPEIGEPQGCPCHRTRTRSSRSSAIWAAAPPSSDDPDACSGFMTRMSVRLQAAGSDRPTRIFPSERNHEASRRWSTSCRAPPACRDASRRRSPMDPQAREAAGGLPVRVPPDRRQTTSG